MLVCYAVEFVCFCYVEFVVCVMCVGSVVWLCVCAVDVVGVGALLCISTCNVCLSV